MTVSSFHGVIILLCAIWTNICALPLENKDTVCRDCLGFFYRKSKSVFIRGNIIDVNECFTDYPYIGFNCPQGIKHVPYNNPFFKMYPRPIFSKRQLYRV